jgi:hypothetical protein
MQLAYALFDELLSLGAFGGDRELDLRHSWHEIGFLSWAFIEDVALVGMAWQGRAFMFLFFGRFCWLGRRSGGWGIGGFGFRGFILGWLRRCGGLLLRWGRRLLAVSNCIQSEGEGATDQSKSETHQLNPKKEVGMDLRKADSIMDSNRAAGGRMPLWWEKTGLRNLFGFVHNLKRHAGLARAEKHYQRADESEQFAY